MKILIIGNGFDLAHDLPTKYTDFLDCVIFLNKSNDKYGLRNAAEKLQLWAEFSKIVSDNTWLKYFIQRYNNKQLKGARWIDFEEELSEVIEEFENWYYTNDDKEITIFSDVHNKGDLLLKIIFHNFIKQYPDCYDKLEKDYWGVKLHPPHTSDFIDFLIQELKNFTRAFEIYCICLVNDVNSSNRTNRIMKPYDFDCVLSFNYTNTYATLYGNEKTKYCYIHGSAQKFPEKTNMILGVNDKLEYKEADNNFAFVNFKKYWQRIILNIGHEYNDWIKLIRSSRHYNEVHEISIVGHSFGETDYDTLRVFLNLVQNQNMLVKIYYHNDEARTILMQRTIGIIGKSSFVQRFSDRAILFIDQYNETDGLFKLE